jgi:hypothetical protein
MLEMLMKTSCAQYAMHHWLTLLTLSAITLSAENVSIKHLLTASSAQWIDILCPAKHH